MELLKVKLAQLGNGPNIGPVRPVVAISVLMGQYKIVPSKGARGMDNYPTMLQTFASTYKRVLRPMTLEPTHSIRLPTPINGRQLVATSYRHGLRVKDAFTLSPNFRGCVVSTTSN